MAAAVYLHNAIFSPESSRPPSPNNNNLPAHHGRNISSQSSMTVTPSYRTSRSEFSYPTEPLLHPDTSGFLPYADMLSRQPTHPKGPRSGWNLGLSLDGDPLTLKEREDIWQQAVKRRLKWLSLIKGTLEVLMGAWATYNTARYLAAFMSYSASGAQAATLALGTFTTLSLSLLVASALISSFSTYIITSRITSKLLRRIRVVLRGLATFLLLLPAIVAFALVFAWRNASELELRFRGRCHCDIDVVWSGPGSRCEANAPTWGTWLVASLLRLIFTLITVVTYHLTSIAYAQTRRPSPTDNPRFRRLKLYKPSYSVSEPTLAPQFQTTTSSKGTTATSKPVSLQLTQYTSSSTLVDNPRTRNTSTASGPPKSLHSDRSRPSLHNVNPPSDPSRPSSDADVISMSQPLQYTTPATPVSVDASSPSSIYSQTSDPEIHGFVDRFRTLVDQVSREVDAGLEVVRRESVPVILPPPPPLLPYADYYANLNTTPMLTAEELDALIRNEELRYERPRTPDDHVMVLGGYIRRMPTIESLGSREMSSVASSAHRNGTFMSTHSQGSGYAHQSRPPTRPGTAASETAAHESPSKNNSLNASSLATGGHGGSTSSTMDSYRGNSAPDGEKMLLEDLVESPTNIDAPQGHGIIK